VIFALKLDTLEAEGLSQQTP